MKKIYVLGPLAGLLIFSGVYWKYSEAHEAQLAETSRRDDLARQAKARQQEADRIRAAEQAKIAIAKRDQERAEKQKLDEAQKQARIDLEQRRDTASTRVSRLRPQIDHLRSELDAVGAAIARNEERTRELQREQAFLADYVRQAEANRKTFYDVLEKLEHAETPHPAAPPANRAPADKG